MYCLRALIKGLDLWENGVGTERKKGEREQMERMGIIEEIEINRIQKYVGNEQIKKIIQRVRRVGINIQEEQEGKKRDGVEKES